MSEESLNLKVLGLIDEIGKLSITEVLQLCNGIQEKWNISPSSFGNVGASSGDSNAASPAVAAAEPVNFDVKLKDIGDINKNKVPFIKAMTGLNMTGVKFSVSEASAFLKNFELDRDGANKLRSSVNKDEADKMRKAFEGIPGVIIEISPSVA